MSQTLERPAAEERASERQNLILDAAARCFARAGFHRTTMQDVAAEASMSPGNLYRYFPSKDAVIAGLVERDRADMAEQFSADPGTDVLTMLRDLGHRHFAEGPPDKSMMCVQIWAEATRDPAILAMHTAFEQDMLDRFQSLFQREMAKGSLPRGLNCAAVARIIMKLADGLFVRRAAASDYDPEREVEEVFTVITALLDGTIRFPETTVSAE